MMAPPAGGRYNGEGWFWKPASIALISCLFTAVLSGSLSFMYFTSTYVTKAEVQHMVENAPFPYLQDKKWIEKKFDDMGKRMDKLEAMLNTLHKAVWKSSAVQCS